jgi:hypothetical protein
MNKNNNNNNNNNNNSINNTIHILSSQCTQKTSTFDYLPKELLESSDSINIPNFQIHTCKDSVLSPLIPCIACSNENKRKNRNFTYKLRNNFKKWMYSLTHNKQKNDNSMIYTSSATITVPIYFGDQKASPEDQNRHQHHRHASETNIFKNKNKSKNKNKNINDNNNNMNKNIDNNSIKNNISMDNNVNTNNDNNVNNNKINNDISMTKNKSDSSGHGWKKYNINNKSNISNLNNKSLRESASTPAFVLPNKSTQYPKPMFYHPSSVIIPNYFTGNRLITSPSLPNFNQVIETKKNQSEILPIANDINKMNSAIRIKQNNKIKGPSSTTPTPASTSTSNKAIITTVRLPRNVSMMNRHVYSKDFVESDPKIIRRKISQRDQREQFDQFNYVNHLRPQRRTTDSQQDKHKGIIYYSNSRQNLEKEALSHQGSSPNLELEREEELKRQLNNTKISVHEGYNESIFSSPITPEMKPMEIDESDEDDDNDNSDINIDINVNINVNDDDNDNKSDNNSPILKSKQSIGTISVKSTSSSISIKIKDNSTKLNSNNLRNKRNSSILKRHSKSLQSLYKDICVLGLSIDHLAEKYSSTD